MNEFWEKVEHYNAKLITPALIILLFIIVYEIFFHYENHTLEIIIEIIDYLIIAVFGIDLVFLALRARTVKFFFKHYWLDLIAIIPVGLLFGLINQIYRAFVVAEELLITQKILHESLEIEKELKGVAKEGKLFTKESKLTKLATTILKPALRGLRVIAKSHLFTKFQSKHHLERRHQNNLKEKNKQRFPRKLLMT